MSTLTGPSTAAERIAYARQRAGGTPYSAFQNALLNEASQLASLNLTRVGTQLAQRQQTVAQAANAVLNATEAVHPYDHLHDQVQFLERTIITLRTDIQNAKNLMKGKEEALVAENLKIQELTARLDVLSKVLQQSTQSKKETALILGAQVVSQSLKSWESTV